MESAPESAVLQKINVARILTLMFALKMSARSKQQSHSGRGWGTYYSSCVTLFKERHSPGVGEELRAHWSPAASSRVIRGYRLSLSTKGPANGTVHSGHLGTMFKCRF